MSPGPKIQDEDQGVLQLQRPFRCDVEPLHGPQFEAGEGCFQKVVDRSHLLYYQRP